jgi:hypothetical protein
MTKKTGLVVVLAILVAGGAFAVDWQAYPDSIKQGTFLINAGIGFGTTLSGSMVVPPLSASVDYALPLGGLPFTVGALLGFTTSKYKSGYGIYEYTWSYTGIAIAGRFGYHPDFGVKNLDVYANIGLGYYIYTGKADYPSNFGGYKYDPDNLSTPYFDFDIGAHYFFTNNIGAFLEVGYSYLSFITAGVALKF